MMVSIERSITSVFTLVKAILINKALVLRPIFPTPSDLMG